MMNGTEKGIEVTCSNRGCRKKFIVPAPTAGTKLGNACCPECLERERRIQASAKAQKMRQEVMSGL